jgi:AAA15 family ATPase/GTPase
MIYYSACIKNFRGIQELNLDELGLVNIFAGGNSIGKTTLLEALALGHGILSVSDKLNTIKEKDNDFSSLSHVIESAVVSIISKFKLAYKSTVQDNEDSFLPQRLSRLKNMFDYYEFYKSNLCFITPQGERQKVFSILLNKENQLLGKSLNTQEDAIEMVYEIKKASEIAITANDLDEEESLISHSEVPQNLDNEMIKAEGLAKTILSLNTHTFYLPSISLNIMTLTYQAIEKLQDNIQDLDKLLEGVQKAFPQHNLQDLRLKSKSKIICRLGRVWFPLDVMGEGFKKILLIQSKLLTDKPKYLFIDEIENGLHYSVQKALWEILLNYAIEHQAQIFITTHSYEILTHLKEVCEALEEQGILPSTGRYKQNAMPKSIDILSHFSLEHSDKAGHILATCNTTFSFADAIEHHVELRGRNPHVKKTTQEDIIP